jgi:hypothetical protein
LKIVKQFSKKLPPNIIYGVSVSIQTHVECYSGSEYPERPVAFWWQGQRLVVAAVRSEARLPEGKRFLVETDGEQVFEINYNETGDTWTVRDVS